jgi:hypothetical protein
VWVAAGTYVPTQTALGTTTRHKTFLMKAAVKVYGGFQGVTADDDLSDRNPALYATILSGDLDGDDGANFANRDDNAYHVVLANGEEVLIEDTTLLDGFTIRGGNANTSDGMSRSEGYLAAFGGGILIITAGPVIQNCLFIDNRAATAINGGGGGAAHNSGHGPCTVFPCPQAHPQFISCSFVRNQSVNTAGACSNYLGKTTFVNCSFSNNAATTDGGALYNAAVGEGGLRAVDVFNCSFAGNSGSDGSAIYIGGTGTSLVMGNSIIWGNSGTQLAFDPLNPNIGVAYSDLEDEEVMGTTIISVDPLFASITGDNLRINSASGCRNVGNNNGAVEDTYDVDNDGNPTIPIEAAPDRDRLTRILNTTVDLGAYESHAPSTCCDIDQSGCVNVDDLLAVINNWGLSGSADIANLGDFNSPLCAGDGAVDVNDLLAVIGV